MGQSVEIHFSPLLTHEAPATGGGKEAAAQGASFSSSRRPSPSTGLPGWRMPVGVWIPLGWSVSMWATGGSGLTLTSTHGSLLNSDPPSVVSTRRQASSLLSPPARSPSFVLLCSFWKWKWGCFLRWRGTSIPRVDRHQNRIQG